MDASRRSRRSPLVSSPSGGDRAVRASAKGEFDPLTQQGETPPAFRPSVSHAGAPLNWVAVVDLMQLLGTSSGLPNDRGVRLRLQTPAIPLAEHQRAAKQELIKAVAAELLGYSSKESCARFSVSLRTAVGYSSTESCAVFGCSSESCAAAA